MFSEYLFGRMYLDVEYAMLHMLISAGGGACVVFCYCCRLGSNDIELRRRYRKLTFVAECFGTFALLGVATFFGHSLITHNKNTLNANREALVTQVATLSNKIQKEYCSKLAAEGIALAFKENQTPLCQATKLQGEEYDDVSIVNQKIHQLEQMSVLTVPVPLMLKLDELRSDLQKLAHALSGLTKHDPRLILTTTNPALVLLALLSAIVTTSIKTGKAGHEWFANRKK